MSPFHVFSHTYFLRISIKCCNFCFQCFDTIEQAYNYADSEEMENTLIFIHTGVYQGEFLVIDNNVSLLGAGEYK
jgi:pectin methylesterase-like acyl-CoA thioesterase